MTVRVSHAIAARPGLSALRATMPGAGIVLGLFSILAAAGALPEGTAPHGALGVGLAVLGALAAAGLHGRMAAGSAAGGALEDGSRITRALALGFLVKLGALAGGAGALVLAGAKFPQLASFAVAFAAAVLLCQGGAAWLMARQLARRHLARSGGPETAGAASQPR